jgi:isopenicillin N synthase-like dioxygenase
MKSIIPDLQTKGFTTLQYPPELREAVESAVGAWRKFYALPEEVKKTLPYSNAGAGVGYELKDGVGPKADRKENFDVAFGGQEWLLKNAPKINEPIISDLILKSLSLAEMVRPLAISFAQVLQYGLGIDDLGDEVEEGRLTIFPRFIHYFGDREVGEEIAAAHPDQSGFTLHLYEDETGVQCLTQEKQWVDMPGSSGETVVFPAMQLQLRSEGKLEALCHRVVATPKTAKNGRTAVVCFVQLAKSKKYNKDVHGRLQEKTPGFNYKMALEDFEKLFV